MFSNNIPVVAVLKAKCGIIMLDVVFEMLFLIFPQAHILHLSIEQLHIHVPLIFLIFFLNLFSYLHLFARLGPQRPCSFQELMHLSWNESDSCHLLELAVVTSVHQLAVDILPMSQSALLNTGVGKASLFQLIRNEGQGLFLHLSPFCSSQHV